MPKGLLEFGVGLEGILFSGVIVFNLLDNKFIIQNLIL